MLHKLRSNLCALSFKSQHYSKASVHRAYSVFLSFDDPDNQRILFDVIGQQLKVQNHADWYKISSKDIMHAAKEKGVSKRYKGVLRKYFNGSFVNALRNIYAETKWDPFKFSRLSSPEYTPEFQKQVFQAVAAELGIVVESDWYKFSGAEAERSAEKIGLKKHVNFIIMQLYKGSFTRAIKAIYPSTEWCDFHFRSSPKKSLKSVDVQRKIFDDVSTVLGITSPDEWYRFGIKEVVEAGAKLGLRKSVTTILNSWYNTSLMAALKALYPEHNWNPLLFRTLPRITVDQDILKKAVNMLEQKLAIHSIEDWYRISKKQTESVTKLYVISKAGGLSRVLPQVYPSVEWNMERFNASTPKRAEQRLLHAFVKTLLGPHVEVVESYFPPEFIFKNSTEGMELDVFVPSYKLALEYNGAQHYKDIGYFGSFREYELRDREKQKACKANGITLIIIPYTWNSSIASIAATIRSVRPDIPLRDDHIPRTEPIVQPQAITV